MADLGGFFNLGAIGGFSTGLVWLIILYGSAILIFFVAGRAIWKKLGFDYLLNIYREQAGGAPLYLRDFIFIKKSKEDPTKKYWKLEIAGDNITPLPNSYIVQTKQSLQYFRKKGLINLYQDKEGNYYPMQIMNGYVDEQGRINHILYPEPRDWKEAFAQDVAYRSKKLVPQKWYQNVVTVGILVVGVVGMMIVLMIKVGAPHIN